jgi:hypothetical protein
MTASPLDIESFRRWVMTSVSHAPVHTELGGEELGASTALSEPALREPDDLPEMIEVVREAEMFCGRQLQELNRRTYVERQPTADANEWKRTMQLIAMHSETKWWNGRIEWLQDTRIYLEKQDPRSETARAPTRSA